MAIWFTADGYTDKCKKSNGVYFVFNIRKEKDADRIILILKDEFNLKARKIFDDELYMRRVKHPEGVWRVLLGSVVLKRFLRDNIGTYSFNKHIPNWLMQHPDVRIVKAYLQGLFGGDGWLNKNRSGNSIGFCTTSKSLVVQLQMLLTRIGVFGRIYAREGGICTLSGNPAKKQYILYCQEKIMFDILGFAYKKIRPTKCYVDFDENFAVKVTGVEKKDYDGEVFNLSTETQTYLANNVVVHNCGLLHLVRGHSVVQSPEYWEIYNLAADAVTNFILAENGFMISKKVTSIIPDVYANNVQIKMENGSSLYTIEKIKEKTVEKVFHELCKNLPFKFINVHLVGGKGDKDGKGIKRFDMHGFGEGKEAGQKAEKEWKQRLINAITRAKSIGQLPSGLDRYVEKILEPKVRWQDILYRFVTEQMPHNYTYRYPHKRSEVLGYYIPSYVKEMLRVASFIDTSGSISSFAISEFKSENIGIARAFESVQIHIGYIDVKVHDVLEISNGNTDKIIDFVPKGGGGTDMRNVFTWLDRNLPDAELVVIFTDGYTPWPKPEQICQRKVLWLVNTNEKVPSGIGEVIRYDSEQL